MFNIKNVTTSTTEERYLTPTYNIAPNVTVPPFVNLIGDLESTNVITNPITVLGTIVDGIILSGTLLTEVDCSINLVNAIILHGIINTDTTLTNVTITTVCGTTFTNLEIQDAVIDNVTIINVET